MGLYLSFLVLATLAVVVFILVASFTPKFARSMRKYVKVPLPVHIFAMDDWRPSTMKPWECSGWYGLLKLVAL